MPEPTSLSVREAAREIAARRLSAEDYAKAWLERVAAREPVVGAWRYLDRDQALAAARRCDNEPPRGPLHGIPIAVKDMIDTVDMPTELWLADLCAVIGPRRTRPASRWRGRPARSSSARPSPPNSPDFHPGQDRQPAQPGAHAGRLVERLGRGGGRRHGAARLRHANRRLGDPSGAFCGCVGYKPSFGTDHPRRRSSRWPTASTRSASLRASVDDAAFFAGVLSERPRACASSPCRSEPPRFGLYRTPVWDEAEPATAAALDTRARGARTRRRRGDGTRDRRPSTGGSPKRRTRSCGSKWCARWPMSGSSTAPSSRRAWRN